MTNPYYTDPPKHPLIIEFMFDENGNQRNYEIFGKTVIFTRYPYHSDAVSYKYEDGNIELRLTAIVVPTTKTDAELQYVTAVNFWGHGETISNRMPTIDAAVKDLQQIVTHRYRFMQPFMSK